MHEGHRQRLISKIKTADGLYEHELLEVLLFNACPRKNVNPVAHGLIKAFGSISGVLNASVEELTKVEGVGRNMAEYLVCIGKCLNKRNGCNSFAIVRSTAEFKHFISVRAMNCGRDKLEIYCLDKDGRVRRVCAFSGKEDGRVCVSSEQILKIISVYKPYGIFAAYYRANGNCEPTKADDDMVGQISLTCSLSGIRFYDYCIACGGAEIFSYFVTDRLTRAGAAGELKYLNGKGAGNGRF